MPPCAHLCNHSMPPVVVLNLPEGALPTGCSSHRQVLHSQGVPQCVCQRPCVWDRTPLPAPSSHSPLRFCPCFVLLPEFSVNAAQLKSLEARLTGDEVLWVLQGLPLACPSLSCTRHCASISDHPCKPRSETESSVDCFQRVLTPPWPPLSGGSRAAGSGTCGRPCSRGWGPPLGAWSDGQEWPDVLRPLRVSPRGGRAGAAR